MSEAVIFDEDDRVELVDGEVMEMVPIGNRHVESVMRLNRLLSRWAYDTVEYRSGRALSERTRSPGP